MSTYNDPGEVRLGAQEAEDARSGEDDVLTSVKAMAGLIVDAVQGTDPDRVVDVTSVSADFGVHVLVVHGPEYCYVYDGKAGVCRPCTPEEEVGSRTLPE